MLLSDLQRIYHIPIGKEDEKVQNTDILYEVTDTYPSIYSSLQLSPSTDWGFDLSERYVRKWTLDDCGCGLEVKGVS